jgi:hypothetical protein
VWSNSRGFASIVGAVDVERLDVIEAGLAAIGPEPTAGRAKLLAALASELSFSRDNARRVGTAEDALAVARTVDDPVLLSDVQLRVTPPLTSIRRAREQHEQLIQLSRRCASLGDPVQHALADILLSCSHLMLGELDACRTITESLPARVADLPATYRWFALAYSVRGLLFEGRIDDALRRNDESLAMSEAVGQPDGLIWWAAIVLGIHRLRQTLGDMADSLGEFADQYPDLASWRYAHIEALAFAGRTEEARRWLAATSCDPDELVDEILPGNGLFSLAYVAHLLDDAALARVVIEACTPFDDLWSHYFTYSVGPMTMPLGIAQLVCGDVETAIATLEGSRRQVLAAGYAGLLPVVLRYLYEALVAGGRHERAAEVLAELRERAAAVGAPAVLAAAEAVGGRT